MSAPANRRRRAINAPTVLIQGRVTPQTKSEISSAAEESGVTMAYYLDALITQLVAEHGALPRVARPDIKSAQEELPIPMAS